MCGGDTDRAYVNFLRGMSCKVPREVPEPETRNPRSEIKSISSFQIKCYIITVLIFTRAFGPKNNVPKRDFLLYFQKVIGVGEDSFLPKILYEKAKHPGICPFLVVATGHRFVRNIFLKIYYATSFMMKIWLNHSGS